MKIVKVLTTFLVIIFSILQIYAQSELIFSHITMDDGLPDDGAEWIIQDHLGFIWIGTRLGLVKYDGYEFTTYRSGDKEQIGLSKDWIRTVYEDSRGDIWAGANGYLNRYIRNRDTVITYKANDTVDTALHGQGVFAITEDSEGTMWFGNYRGWLNYVEIDELEDQNPEIIFHSLKEKDHAETYIVFGLFEDSYKNLWACTRNGLLKIKDKNIEVIQAVPSKKFNRNNTFFCITQEDEKSYWIGTYGNCLAHYDDNTQNFEFYRYRESEFKRYSSNNILSILLDSKGRLWAGTQGAEAGGLLKFDIQTKSFERYSHSKIVATSLMDGAYFHNIFEDNSGTIWLPVFQKGLTRIDPSVNQIEQYYYARGEKYGLPTAPIYSVHESDDKIWIGTSDGLYNYDPQNGKFKRVNLNLTGACNKKLDIRGIAEDTNGSLWLNGGWGEIVWEFNPGNGNTRCYFQTNDENGFYNPYFTGEYADKKGNVWISTYGGGLHKVDVNTKKITHFPVAGPNSKKDDPEEINKMAVDTSGTIWVASYDRTLNKFIEDEGRFERISFDEFGGHFNTTGMMFDSKNRLWLATRQGGIIRYNVQTKEAKKFLEQDGLPTTDWIRNFFEDKSGNIFCRSPKHLIKFNPSGEFERYYEFNIGNNSFINAFYIRATDEIFLSTEEILIKFSPDGVLPNPTPPKMVITDFNFYDKSLKIQRSNPSPTPINLVETIELEHYQNDIDLEFAALHYTRPEENRYKYILENYDVDWHNAGTDRTAKFVNLSHGKYTFKVLGSNPDGIWANTPASLQIIIHPPWWLTWWAYTLYGILILLTLAAIWITQVRRLHIKNELKMKEFETQKLKEVDQMKSNFFANISHEFRTPLTLIQGPIERFLYDEKRSEKREVFKMMLKNTKKLLNLINELLDLSKLEAGKMKLCAGKYDIVSFTKGVVMSFKSLAESKEIELSVRSEKNFIEVYFDKEKMQKILTNLVANALKFTQERGKIDVLLSERSDKNNLTIEVIDNGVGIPAKDIPKLFDRFYQVVRDGITSGSGTGIGLALTKELVQMHKGTIEVESTAGEGAKFTISIPLGREHLGDDDIILSDELDTTFMSPEPLNEEEEKDDTKDKPILLVVEDNKDVMKYIKDILKPDYNLIEAFDGKAGLDKAIEVIPDLIVSDIMMPVMDGNKMCELIKTDEKTSHIPIILLTAKAGEGDKIEGLETGADDYMIKPFDPLELVVRIKNLIIQRRNLRKKYLHEAEIHPTEVAVTSVDKEFIEKAIDFVEDNLDNASIGIEQFADRLSMSRSQLYRKFCAVLGEKPNEFIRKYRLKRAADLLKQNFGNVTQVALEVGFNDPAYFTRCFKKLFKMNPLEYEKKHKNVEA